jgi:hypothetical protein
MSYVLFPRFTLRKIRGLPNERRVVTHVSGDEAVDEDGGQVHVAHHRPPQVLLEIVLKEENFCRQILRDFVV